MQLKSMLERFFEDTKKEKKAAIKEMKPIVPDFVEDPEMERIVKEYIEILRARFGYMHDGEIDKVKEADVKAKEMESKYGEVMRIYLKPYMEVEKRESFNVPKSEHDRWQTAGTLKATDKRNLEKK